MVRVSGLFQKQLKNRSSKDLICLTKMKPAVMSMSNEKLDKLVAAGDRMAVAEKKRRAKPRKTPRPKSKKSSDAQA